MWPVHGEHPQREPAQLQLLPRHTADAVANEGDDPGHFEMDQKPQALAGGRAAPSYLIASKPALHGLTSMPFLCSRDQDM